MKAWRGFQVNRHHCCVSQNRIGFVPDVGTDCEVGDEVFLVVILYRPVALCVEVGLGPSLLLLRADEGGEVWSSLLKVGNSNVGNWESERLFCPSEHTGF